MLFQNVHEDLIRIFSEYFIEISLRTSLATERLGLLPTGLDKFIFKNVAQVRRRALI